MTIARILGTKGKYTSFVSPEVLIYAVIDSLEYDDVGALIVSSNGARIDGIISERDVVRGLQKFGPSVLDHTARDLMTTNVITCSASEPVNEVMSKMNVNRIRHIPVVDNDKFIGIINIRDVVQHRLDEVQKDAEGLLDYIAHV